MLQLQFQLLLNTSAQYIPAEKANAISAAGILDTALLSAHPSLQYYRQQQQVAIAATEVEKAKLLPDLTFGYNLMSMKGMGANNKEYNSVPRFQSMQVGIGIPIFNSGQKARINAAKTNETIAAYDYEVNHRNLETAYRTALASYDKYSASVQYFETIALLNAEIITTTANKQFTGGDINYLEWVMLVSQAVNIQNDYIEAVKNRNSAIVEINSFIKM